MSIEAKIDQLIEALNRNTAALTAEAPNQAAPAKPAKAKAAAAAPAPTPAPAAPPAAPQQDVVVVTKEMIQAAGNDLTELAELDRAKAVAILGEFGVQKMTAAPPAQIPAIHAKVKKVLAEIKNIVATGVPSLV